MKLLRKRELKNRFNLLKAHEIEPSNLECSLDFNRSPEEEHMHWGAYVDEKQNVIFKFATFPDAISVGVEIKSNKKRAFKILPLENKCNGVFELKVDKKIAGKGDRYRFIIDRPNQPKKRVRDPYSMLQDNFSSWSIIFDHHGYRWHDKKWREGRNPARVSRLAGALKNLSPLGSLRIFEVNIPSLTEKGTYHAAKSKFAEAAKLGFNAVQIMPVENCFSYNWGYDGVDKFAPNRTYGTPNDLKDLIDYAHSINLNVIMDIVPNHFGPDMVDIQNAGPYTDGCNEFGLKFNYENSNYEHARKFIVNAALNWLVNYHCDGLRFDLTKYMNSDYTMKLIAAELHFHQPDAFLIAEDARENDKRVTAKFSPEEIDDNNRQHKSFINKIMENDCSLSALGFDSEWDFPYHKQIAALMLEYWCGYPKSIAAFDKVVKNSGQRVKYAMSHDEIGNIDGTRLITKIFAKEINIYKNIPKNKKHKREQEFAHVSHNILKKLLTGELEKMKYKDFLYFAKHNYLALSVTVSSLKQAYRKALKMYRLALGATFSIPGPKMVFQGDEKGEMTYFKFFREFSSGYEKNLETKGYKPGYEALMDSKIGSVHYCHKYAKDLVNTAKFMHDINKFNAENKALQNGTVAETISHALSWVHATYCKGYGNEVFSITNFSDVSYLNNYKIIFPEGVWKEEINSDNQKYGGEGSFLNDRKIYSDSGKIPVKISLPAYGTIYFTRIA
ncbi:MAG: alpha amylase C-terminal domain-containing protein [Candidatus Gastranaerophilales bacterium]|nr:alpha amylase C-terminal domain-containing protein [Candidatus Gastranaerophilales bacterium]